MLTACHNLRPSQAFDGASRGTEATTISGRETILYQKKLSTGSIVRVTCVDHDGKDFEPLAFNTEVDLSRHFTLWCLEYLPRVGRAPVTLATMAGSYEPKSLNGSSQHILDMDGRKGRVVAALWGQGTISIIYYESVSNSIAGLCLTSNEGQRYQSTPPFDPAVTKAWFSMDDENRWHLHVFEKDEQGRRETEMVKASDKWYFNVVSKRELPPRARATTENSRDGTSLNVVSSPLAGDTTRTTHGSSMGAPA